MAAFLFYLLPLVIGSVYLALIVRFWRVIDSLGYLCQVRKQAPITWRLDLLSIGAFAVFCLWLCWKVTVLSLAGQFVSFGQWQNWAVCLSYLAFTMLLCYVNRLERFHVPSTAGLVNAALIFLVTREVIGWPQMLRLRGEYFTVLDKEGGSL